MARIPDAEVERIKREVSLVRLVEARGIVLRGKGDNLLGLCPFHDDKDPSLVISPSKNVWHCLGACRAGGSVIDWVMRTEGCSFRLAVEMLERNSPSLAADRPKTRAPLGEIAETGEPDSVVLRRVVDFYHRTLEESGEAIAYLESRGLRSREMIDAFHLGHANRTLGYRLPQKQVKAGEALRTQLQRIGILRGSGHEHLAGSLVIPVFGEDGEVLELYGRKIRSDLRKGTPNHLYLPRREDGRRGVFNLAGLKTSKEVILCEALIDALTFWCAGFRNVTSAYGVEGFTAEMREAFLAHGIERVLIAYDRDAAGNQAAASLADELAKDGLAVFRVPFPKGMDANEYAQKVQPAAKSLATAIQSAEWMAGTRRVTVPEAIAELIETPRDTTERSASSIAGTNEAPSAALIVAPTSEMNAAPIRETNLAPAVEAEATPSDERDEPEREPQDNLQPSAAPAAAQAASESTDAEAKTEPPSLAADPSPAPHIAPKLDADVSEDEVRIRLGDRWWRLRGLAKNTTSGSLRVSAMVVRGDDFFVDTLELYSARQRAAFLKQAAAELAMDELVLKSDLGKIVLRLEEIIEQRIREVLAPKQAVTMSDEEREGALALLRDPRLLDRVLEDFDRAGVVGEETNKLVGYLAAVSRKLEAPLAVVIQSSSAAGKSSLMDAVLRFMPEEERVQYSAMTGQSLFYMGETDLAHKILAIAEEEGVRSAAYALKLLQSEGELRIASTGKDPVTGKLVTHEYRVKGPVMIFLTTTAIEIDEELLNRCVVLTVDEGAEQTSAIHARQRESQTIEGLLLRHDRDRLVALHQNAQRLLEPLFVANPFAKTLRFASQATRTRRDHMKYLTLIRAIALLHQHQRAVKEVEHRGERIRYIEVTEADLAIADRLSSGVLTRCLDELPPQTRVLLEEIDRFVAARAKKEAIEKSAVRFTRRQIREATKLSHTQLRIHMQRLEELEYLLVHAGGGKRRFVYSLASDAQTFDPNLKGEDQHLKGAWRPLEGGAPRQESPSDPAKKKSLEGPFGKPLLPAPAKVMSYAKANGAAERT